MVRGRIRVRALAAVGLLLVGLVGTAIPTAAADPRGELDKVRSEKERVAAKKARKAAKARELSALVGQLDAKRAKVEAEVNAYDSQLDQLDMRIERVVEDLQAAQQRVAFLTDELQGVLGRLDDRTAAFSERAVAIYKAGPTIYLDGLLTAESFSDLVDQQAYYQSALDTDAELVNEIEVLRDQTEDRRTEIIERQEQIAAAKRRLEVDRRRVASLRSERADVLAERQAIVDEKASILADVRADQSRLAAIEEELERDEARLESIIASSGSSSSGALPVGGGQLAWPAAGPVTSPYGYRTHPIFGDQRLHTGIDIGAPYGAPVVAADDGVVVFAGVMSGYGNAIVVDHGGGLATTYNHLSAFSVGSGQQVGRRTPIGAVGCSGYCTGPHLHFEVRVNGSPVDPMPYLQ